MRRQAVAAQCAACGADRLPAVVRSGPCRQFGVGVRRGRTAQKVDQPVLGVRAVAGAARTAHHLDAARNVVHRFHQRVDVGEARGAHRHAVFEIEERSGAGAAGQHGRANGRQVFGAAALLDAETGQAVQRLGRLHRQDETGLVAGNPRNIADMRRAGCAEARGRDDKLVQYRRLILRGGAGGQRHGQCERAGALLQRNSKSRHLYPPFSLSLPALAAGFGPIVTMAGPHVHSPARPSAALPGRALFLAPAGCRN